MAVVFGSELLAAEAAELEAKPAEAPAPTEQPASEDEPSSAPADGEKPPEVSRTADESETPGEGEDAPKPKADGGFQRRIDKLTRKIHDQEREIEALKRASNPAPSAEPSTAGDPDKEPQQDDFGNYEDYLKAVGRYEARQAIKEEREALERKQAEEAFVKRLEPTKAKHADFDEVIQSAGDIVIPDAAVAAIQHSDDPGEIMYHLAMHPEEAEKLAGMNPIQQVRAIARIEAQISSAEQKPAEPPTPKPKVAASSAPPPLKPVPGSSTERPKFDPHTADSSDPRWAERRKQRIAELAAADA